MHRRRRPDRRRAPRRHLADRAFPTSAHRPPPGASPDPTMITVHARSPHSALPPVCFPGRPPPSGGGRLVHHHGCRHRVPLRALPNLPPTPAPPACWSTPPSATRSCPPLLGASGRADQPGDRGPGRPVGRGARRRRGPAPDADPRRAPARLQIAVPAEHADPGDLLLRGRPRRGAGRSPTPSRPRTSPTAPRGSTRSTTPASTRVETRTESVVDDLRSATAAAQKGTGAEHLFQSAAGRRPAQRAGQPARPAHRAREQRGSPRLGHLACLRRPERRRPDTRLLMPVGGALAGLALGLPARLAARAVAGVVRSGSRGRGARAARRRPRSRRVAGATAPAAATAMRRRSTPTIRRLRARSWTSSRGRTSSRSRRRGPAGPTPPSPRRWRSPSPGPATAWCWSAPTHADHATASGWTTEGWPQALLHERLNVLDLLQPTVEPLLSPAAVRRLHRPEPRAARRRPGACRALAADRGRPPGRHPVTRHRQRRGRGVPRCRRPRSGRRDRRTHAAAGPSRSPRSSASQHRRAALVLGRGGRLAEPTRATSGHDSESGDHAVGDATKRRPEHVGDALRPARPPTTAASWRSSPGGVRPASSGAGSAPSSASSWSSSSPTASRRRSRAPCSPPPRRS